MDASTQPCETGAISHTGLVRRANEDRYVACPEFGIWAVADGMGGHENGALASARVASAVASIGKAASAPDLLAGLEAAILAANADLRELSLDRPGRPMGSTMAALLLYEPHFACVWAGDSRVYLVRDGAISQVSRDHTEVQDLVDKGVLTPEEARHSPRRNIITRAIGVHETPELDLENGVLAAGDTFVLCSDGLTNHVADAEILAAASGSACQAACEALLALTLQRGASDNVTVVIVRYHRPGVRTTRWMPNMRTQRSEGR